MEISFKDKVALVTGAAGGIGLMAARMFAESGASVALADIDGKVMERAEELAAEGYNGEFYQFNLSSCIRQQNSLTAQFVSFSLSNLANIFYPPNFYNN